MSKKAEPKFLYLSREDMISCGVLDMHECVETIEEGFRIMGDGDYIAGGPGEHEHGLKLWFPKHPRGKNMPTMGPDRRVMAMVGYLGGDFNICGVKWYGSNKANPREFGLHRSIHIVVLNDVVTGLPIAIMEGNFLSAMRTGATVGVAAKYLAKKDAKVLGIIGAGVIGRTCLMALADVLTNLTEVKVFDIIKNKAETFSNEMSEKLNLKIYATNSYEEAVVKSDVISVAASGKNPPLIKDEWLRDGSLLILSASIAPIKELYINNKLVADDWKQHLKWISDQEERNKIEPSDTSYSDHACTYIEQLIKEKKIQENRVIDLFEILRDRNKGRIDDKEKIIYINGGLPMEDLAWGYKIYKKALEKNIGQQLYLWKKIKRESPV